MTKLEVEMMIAISKAIEGKLLTDAPKAAAKVAKRYILKVFEDSSHHDGYIDQWLKDNGVTD